MKFNGRYGRVVVAGPEEPHERDEERGGEEEGKAFHFRRCGGNEVRKIT